MKHSHSLTLKFILTVFLPTALLSLFVIVVITDSVIRAQHDAYGERFEKSWNALSHSLSSSVWTYDLKAIESTIESYTRVWDVTGVAVLDQYETVLSSSGTISTEVAASHILPLHGHDMGNIGEIRLWFPRGQTMSKGFLPTLSRIAAFIALLMVLSCYFYYRAMLKHIHAPLEDTLALLQSGKFDAASQAKVQAMPNEVRQLAESVIAQQKHNKSVIEGLKTDLEYTGSLANLLQSLLSESDQTCVVIDDNGQILIRNISQPFSEQHMSTLVNIVSNVVSPVEGLTAAGFEVHRVFSGSHASVAMSYEIVAENGETLMVKILRLQKSYRALIAHNVSHAKWSDLLVDELLRLGNSGLAIFDRAGRLQMDKGESVGRLLANHIDKTEINLARILLEFPKIDRSAESGTVSFEHKISDDLIYHVHFSQHEQSGIGITHHNITEERQVEAQLIESQRLNDLGRITNGVAHDFNNSLGIVIGQLELAAASVDISRKTQHIDTALSAANQSANVVKQLMTYSRKQVQDLAIVALDEVIEERKSVFQSAVGDGVSIHYDLAFDGVVYLDEELFISTMLNLFLNASDAMDGRGSVFVTTSRYLLVEGKRRMFVLSVQDTGDGVPTEFETEIFQPFFSTKKNNAGNGLGLSMVQGFVDQLAGHIRIENNDVGACFSLYLPEYLAIPSNQTATPEIRPLQNYEQTVNGPDSTLVIIDDNELLLETNAQLLRSNNIKVEVFSDCFLAIEFISEAKNVGCVMVDMKMPQMSGLEFVGQISSYVDCNKIILCSGSFDKHDVELARKRGIHKILRKPLTCRQTMDAVRTCISFEQPQREPQAEEELENDASLLV